MLRRLCWILAFGFLFLPLVCAQSKPQGGLKRPPAASPSAQTPGQERRREAERDEVREREAWFYKQRAFPFKRIPPGARARALQRVEEMRRAERQRGFIQAPGTVETISANTMTWTPIGPQPSQSDVFQPVFGFTSGRVSALAVNPANPDVLYLGGAQGGLWITTDGGANWTPLTDNQPSLAVGSIALDTTTCNSSGCGTIYVGTGEQVFSGDSYYGAGILKSTDGGMTWTQLGQSTFGGPFNPVVGGARIGSLAVNTANPQILLAGGQIFVSVDTGTSSGIYRSTDGGQSWMQVLSGAVGTEVFFDPNNPNVAWAALGSPDGDPQNGIYRSADSGATWTRNAGTSLPTANLGRIEIAIAPSSSSTLYASIADSSTGSTDLLGVFKSTNGGTSWTQLFNTPDFCTPQCWYDHVIRVHPNNADVVYAGGSAANFGTGGYFIRTTDGGGSWQSQAVGSNGLRIHVDVHALAFGLSGTQAVRLYNGNDGGVWSADVSNATGLVNWVNLNNNLSLTQHYPGISIHTSDEGLAIAGSQDNDTHRYTGGLSWQQIGPGCDGGFTVIDPAVPSTWFITCQFINIFRSLNNGTRTSASFFADFDFADNGIDFSDDVAFIAPLVVDPQLTNRLYFGTFRVWQTTDRGDSWKAISPDLTGGAGTIRAIAVSPSEAGTVYVGTSGGRIQRTSTAGPGTMAVWEDLTRPELPIRVVTQIAVGRSNASLAYATFSGFGSCAGCDGKGHVFRTDNGGISWTDISGTGMGALPDTPVNDIVVDPIDSTGNTLYIGTDVGVFFTTDGGVSWSTLMTGLPNVAVFSLKLHPSSRILRAATHGRSVWDLQLTGLPAFHLRSINPTTADAGSSGFTLTVNGGGFGPASVVTLNSADRPTTFVSANQLTAVIDQLDLASARVLQFAVRDAGQVPTTTNSLPFTVVGPAPTLSSVNPNSAPQGGSPTGIVITGTNFVVSSVVRFNGRDLPTTFDSPTQLRATVFASDLTTGGVFPVTVFNPPPGGGPSNSQPFTVIAPPPPNDDFANAISVTGNQFTDSQNNVSATVEAGDPMPSCVGGLPGLAGNGRARSIWYRFAASANATLSADTGGSAYDTVLTVVTGSPASFTQVACDDDGVAAGGASRLSFTATAGVTYYFMVSAFSGDGGATVFTASIATPPPNDNFATPTLAGTIPFFDAVNNAAATTEAFDPAPSCVAGVPGLVNSGRSRSIWYRYTPSGAGLIEADTIGSDYDTILSVFTGSPGSFVQVACNDDFSGLQSDVTFQVNPGTPVFFMVTAFDGTGGTSRFRLVTGPGVLPDYGMTASPSSVTVARGQSGISTISVTAFSGFSGSVTLSCSGLPSRSTCALNPASVTPAANPATSTLTITTTAGAGFFPPPPGRVVPVPVAAWWIAALLAVLALAVWRRKSPSWRWVGVSMLLLVMALALLQMACGGGGDGGSPPPPPPTGTPPGTYTVTVSGTSGTLTRTTTVTLTVN